MNTTFIVFPALKIPRKLPTGQRKLHHMRLIKKISKIRMIPIRPISTPTVPSKRYFVVWTEMIPGADMRFATGYPAIRVAAIRITKSM